MTKPRVIIESPLNGDIERNLKYARQCMMDSLSRGEAPFASHVLYCHEELLDDNDPAQRLDGLEAGFAWGEAADFVAVYTDLGISNGMNLGIKKAEDRGKRIVYRTLSTKPPTLSPVPDCPHCGSDSYRHGKTESGTLRYKCKKCGRTFQDVIKAAFEHQTPCRGAQLRHRRRTEGETMRNTTRKCSRNRTEIIIDIVDLEPDTLDKPSETAKTPFCPHGCRKIEGGFIACQPNCPTHARLGLGVAVEGKNRKNDPGFEGRERI